MRFELEEEVHEGKERGRVCVVRRGVEVWGHAEPDGARDVDLGMPCSIGAITATLPPSVSRFTYMRSNERNPPSCPNSLSTALARIDERPLQRNVQSHPRSPTPQSLAAVPKSTTGPAALQPPPNETCEQERGKEGFAGGGAGRTVGAFRKGLC